MVTYKTEEERVKQIQDFFSDYKYSILIILFIFGISLGSYFFLQNFFEQKTIEASAVYNSYLEGSSENLDKLRSDFPRSGYTHLALLKESTELLRENKKDEALQVLNNLKISTDGIFGNSIMNKLARINIARIHLSTKNYSQAVEILEKYSNDSDPFMHELKADALKGMGNIELAKEQYQAAISGYSDESLKRIVMLKLSNIEI